MGGGKETGRQKMIGMMYLVLTALLALNVSKSILHAFVVVNNSMESTTTNFNEKNGVTYDAFEKAYQENAQKVKSWYDAAQTVRNESEDLFKYINDCKAKVIFMTEKLPKENVITDKRDTVLSLDYVSSLDNYDVPAMVLGLAEPSSPKEEDDKIDVVNLKSKLHAYRDKMLKLLPAKYAESALAKTIHSNYELGQLDEHGQKVDWEVGLFYHAPLAAAVTHLSKLQADIRNTEADLVKFMFSQVDAGSFKFNKLNPLAISEKGYILQGDTFRADIFLAASDTTQAPEIFIGNYDSVALAKNELKWIGEEGKPISIVDGKGKFTSATPNVGDQSYRGVIKFKDPANEGMFLYYGFKQSYNVAKPSATVSATKMNVLYIGVDNPISVSAAGVAEKDIKPSISSGSLSKNSKGFVARVKKSGKATISVRANVDGEMVSMGKMQFRVKRVPDPIAAIGKVEGEGYMKKNELKVLPGLAAKMKNFDFDLKFRITGFEMVAAGKGIESIPFKSKGGRFTPQMKKVFNSLVKGNKVYFQQIRAKGPDGSTRKLAPIAVTIK